MSITVTATDFIKNTYDDATKTVITEWLVTPTPEEYKTGLDALGDTLIKYKTNKLVALAENAGALGDELIAYTMNVWSPRVVAVVGDLITAVVLEENIFSQLSIQGMIDDNIDQSLTATFGNIEDALAWIAKK